MEKKDTDRMVYDIYQKTIRFLNLKEPKASHVYQISELTKQAYMDTASVPEFEVCLDLIDLLLSGKIDVIAGFYSDDEFNTLTDEEASVFGTEIFMNPKDLFFGGKIRPDIVFRKGKSKYLIIEIDSFLYHSNQEQLTNDKVRERKIQSLGYPVYRFSAKECLDGNSWGTACEIIKILKKENFI